MYEDTLLQLSRDTRFRDSELFPSPLSERRNPACGDEVALQGVVGEHLRFYAQGCAVCVASCAALCQELQHCPPECARARVEEALAFFNGDTDWSADWGSPALPALGAVRARPMRMHCVRLPWEALLAVL
jgi:NifU-like protein involved in Fe-S cluster formation